MDTDPTIPEDEPALDANEADPPKPKRRKRPKRGGGKPKELLEPPVQVHRQWGEADYRWTETLDWVPTRQEVYDRFGAGKYRVDCAGGGRVYWILQKRPGMGARTSEPVFMDNNSPADELAAAQAKIAELERRLAQPRPAQAQPPPHQPAPAPWPGPPSHQLAHPPPQPAAPPWGQWPPQPPAQHFPQQMAAPPGYVYSPQYGWIPMPQAPPQFAPSSPLEQIQQLAAYKDSLDRLFPDGVAGDDPDEFEEGPADLQTIIGDAIAGALGNLGSMVPGMAAAAPPSPAAPVRPVPTPVPSRPPEPPAGPSPHDPLPGETAEHAAELADLAAQLGQTVAAVRQLAHDRGYTADQAVTIGRQLVAQAS
jgi:hypothetical protein